MGKKILETERLVLEELDKGLFKELCALLANERVHRYFPKTLNEEEAVDFLEKYKRGNGRMVSPSGLFC